MLSRHFLSLVTMSPTGSRRSFLEPEVHKQEMHRIISLRQYKPALMSYKLDV
jgi:hypothetical protein